MSQRLKEYEKHSIGSILNLYRNKFINLRGSNFDFLGYRLQFKKAINSSNQRKKKLTETFKKQICSSPPNKKSLIERTVYYHIDGKWSFDLMDCLTMKIQKRKVYI